MLLIFGGIICLVVGMGWWLWNRTMDKAWEKGKSLGLVQGTLQYLGTRIGCSLEDDAGLQDFLEVYQKKVLDRSLPESSEWNRTVFEPQPRSLPPTTMFIESVERAHTKNVEAEAEFMLECERWRKAGIAMWYVMGGMRQKGAQAEIKEILFNLYERHGYALDGLTVEMGARESVAEERFRK
ncbi:MAG: hypothetical protein F4X65_08555 [Chloroflexi bacterium]|nr:hypothetical protein [Chloroflexota bacterium]